jgi:hypothetical protein
LTLAAQKDTITCGVETPTLKQAILHPHDLYFWDFYWNEVEQVMNMVLIYGSQFASIFLKGGNALLDAAIDQANLTAFEWNAYYYASALGVDSWYPLDGESEADHIMWAMEAYGTATYGAQQLIDAWYVYQNWNNLLTWDNDSWVFYQWLQGGMSYNSEFYLLKSFYFDLHVMIMEVLAIVGMSYYDPWMLIHWWPRTLNAGWRLTNDFFM